MNLVWESDWGFSFQYKAQISFGEDKKKNFLTFDGGGETDVDEEADPDEVDMLEAPGDLLPSSRLDCNRNDEIRNITSRIMRDFIITLFEMKFTLQWT